jgi:hypothetical protein
MLRFRIAALSAAAAVVALSSHTSHAAGPPKQLYNKSVVLHWAAGYDYKFTDGSSGHTVIHFARSIYVSGAGRVFQMASRSVSVRGRTTNISAAKATGPGGESVKTSNHHTSGTLHWNGNRLDGIVKVDSGAHHMNVTFDDAFRGCTLRFTSGREENAPGIVQKSMRGGGDKLVMLKATGNSGMSCAVKDGNVFQ